ncbi:hypothetical protein H3143_02105 [Mycoplasma tullyi]|uniref:Uncharacterized protein n=1 Tax=Mycoplasma tullyi TaxID=1612150 RepID=A0A7D7YEN6_9MOLU|nr:hypothetical protein [Mycoplasma tullyi]QMT98279.1 hypothetical protein H3143_02105 [Mycoplasma tullyi]
MTNIFKRSANKKLRKHKIRKPVKVTLGLMGFLVVATTVPLANIPLYGIYNNKKNNENTRKRILKEKLLLSASKEKLLKDNPNAVIPNIVQDFHDTTSDNGDDNYPIIKTEYDEYPFKIVERLKKANIDPSDWEKFNEYIYYNLDRDLFLDLLNSFMSFYPIYHESWLSELTQRILLYRYQKIGINSGFFKQYHTEIDGAYFVDKNNFGFSSVTRADLIAVHKLFGNVPTEVGITIKTAPNSELMIDPITKGLVLTNASIFLESAAGALSPYTNIYVQTNSPDIKNYFDYMGVAIPSNKTMEIPSFPITSILYSIINDKDNQKNDIKSYFYQWVIPVLINFFTSAYYNQQNGIKK